MWQIFTRCSMNMEAQLWYTLINSSAYKNCCIAILFSKLKIYFFLWIPFQFRIWNKKCRDLFSTLDIALPRILGTRDKVKIFGYKLDIWEAYAPFGIHFRDNDDQCCGKKVHFWLIFKKILFAHSKNVLLLNIFNHFLTVYYLMNPIH